MCDGTEVYFIFSIYAVYILILALLILATYAGVTKLINLYRNPAIEGAAEDAVLQVAAYLSKNHLTNADLEDLEEIYSTRASQKPSFSTNRHIEKAFCQVVPAALLHLHVIEEGEVTDVGIAALKQNKAYIQSMMQKLKKSPNLDINVVDLEELVSRINDALKSAGPVTRVSKMKPSEITLKMLLASTRSGTTRCPASATASDIRYCKNENEALRAKIMRLQDEIRLRGPIIAIADDRDLRRRIEELQRDKDRLLEKIRDMEATHARDKGKHQADSTSSAEHNKQIKALENKLSECQDSLSQCLAAVSAKHKEPERKPEREPSPVKESGPEHGNLVEAIEPSLAT